MRGFQDLTGQRFGRLLVLGRDKKPQRNVHFICQCDCGSTCSPMSTDLRRGFTVSCGCHRREVTKRNGLNNTIHGEWAGDKPSPEWLAWKQMRQRCSNPNFPNFKRWGGRGIKVCERWIDSFDNFLADMGRRPSRTHSLDRYPDPDGDYDPTNCRWATKLEQRHNRSIL